MEKKEYRTLSAGTIWNNKTEGGATYVTVPLDPELNKSGEKNEYKKVKIYAEVVETGEIFEIKKFKTFNNVRNADILADLCVELNDEAYAVKVQSE